MSVAQRLPRLLFLTPAAFNKVTGGGVTFSNLFAGWPKDRLATVHNDPVPVSTDVCERYFRLSGEEIRGWGPLGLVMKQAAPRFGAGSSSGSPGLQLLRQGKRLFFGDSIPLRARLTPRLEAWIEEFRPELLYTILGSNAFIELADRVARRFALPAVLHFMDDWPAVINRGGLLSWIERRRMDRQLAQLVGASAARMGICDTMCAAYARRYGMPFEAFQNALEVARWSALAKSDLATSARLDLVYIGSVFPVAQLESLAQCCRAVGQLVDEGLPVHLSIYSPRFYADPHRERLLVHPNVTLQDTITEDEAFFRRLQVADALLLPVNFDDRTVRYIRYSMPTKVPAYLLSGTPILVYGPSAVAQVQYAQEHGWGHVVSKQGIGEVAAGMRAILTDDTLRRRVSAAARRLAADRHDAAKVRVRYQSVLAAASQRGTR